MEKHKDDVESIDGSHAKVNAHCQEPSEVHGVDTDNVEGKVSAQDKVDTHANVTKGIHNFDADGKAPPQAHSHSEKADLVSGKVPASQLGSGTPDATTALFGDQTYKTISTPTGGQTTVPFVSWLVEDSVTITGQAGILVTSKIHATIYAQNDDIYATDWEAPVVRNIVAGQGFDIVLRPKIGTFSGNVTVDWSWQN